MLNWVLKKDPILDLIGFFIVIKHPFNLKDMICDSYMH
jgi:hypothetical protein